jgi:hypothetical protein
MFPVRYELDFYISEDSILQPSTLRPHILYVHEKINFTANRRKESVLVPLIGCIYTATVTGAWTQDTCAKSL